MHFCWRSGSLPASGRIIGCSGLWADALCILGESRSISRAILLLFSTSSYWTIIGFRSWVSSWWSCKSAYGRWSQTPKFSSSFRRVYSPVPCRAHSQDISYRWKISWGFQYTGSHIAHSPISTTTPPHCTSANWTVWTIILGFCGFCLRRTGPSAGLLLLSSGLVLACCC